MLTFNGLVKVLGIQAHSQRAIFLWYYDNRTDPRSGCVTGATISCCTISSRVFLRRSLKATGTRQGACCTGTASSFS